MLSQIDTICNEAGVWPHAFLSGHAHNYQRFTRTRAGGGTQIPYVVCGNGGHNVRPLTTGGNPPLRAPQIIQTAKNNIDELVLDNYDDKNYGYLRSWLRRYSCESSIIRRATAHRPRRRTIS